MHIAVIGAGKVGGTLGMRWAAGRHDVVFGVPDLNEAKYAPLKGHRRIRFDDVTAAGRAADVIVLATPWPATESAVAALGDLSGRAIIDCTNPLAVGPGGLELVIGHTTSGGELVASWAKGASVFKTLNQVGFNVMTDPARFPAPPLMFVAGDDEIRKPMIIKLINELGFEALDAGPLRAARLLEPLGMLWIQLAATASAGRDFTFAYQLPSSERR